MSSAVGPQGVAGSIAKGKRNRSFGGCTACRSRRVKCDEARPICTKCIQAGLTCGYESSLFFESDTAQQGGNGRFRRPLLTLEERRCMSAQLTASVPPSLTTWILEQIDEQCEDTKLSEQIDLQHGPFGAFRKAKEGRVAALHGDVVIQPTPECIAAAESPPQDQLYTIEHVLSPNTLEIIDHLLENNDGQLPSGLWCFPDTDDHFEEQQIVHHTAAPHSDASTMSMLPSSAFQLQNVETHLSIESANISPSISPGQGGLIDFSQSALVLLKHYLSIVLKCLTPFRHSKTPWHVLFVPLVKNTLAGMALQEDIDEASLCVFYGILSISALSLSGTSQAPVWQRKSDIYKQKAYGHASSSLQTAYEAPKKAKYKTQLMALLTMAQMSIVSGDPNETEYFLLESERLIRIRGLGRRKSRKCRLLHHCYTYERIFFESTSRGNARYRHQHLRAAISSGGAANSRDSTSFKLPCLENLEANMLKMKDQELGEDDLHLQLPGLWPAEQYSEIFGLPESYIFLVSLIVRLVRERDGELDDDAIGKLSAADFVARAKVIEGLIKQQRSARPYRDKDLGFLMDATHQAVTIYFYRKIYSTDAGMLQKQVADVRESLLGFENVHPEGGFAAVRLIWPAFVAACEAEQPELRAFFAQLFERASRETGLQVFASTMAEVERIWFLEQAELAPDTTYWTSLTSNT